MVGLMVQPDGYNGTLSLTMLMQYAYGLFSEAQVTGAPDWARTDRFDVQARIGAADMAAMEKLSVEEQARRRQLMLQTLLADRFKLKAHTETKQVPIFELVVAKPSPKLRDAATDTSPSLEKDKDGKPWSGLRFLKDTSIAQGYSMKSLAQFLSAPVSGVGRSVVDKTGLTGAYDFTLNWSVYSAQIMVRDGVAVGAHAGDDAPSIFTALQELGLKLQPATGPIDNIVIDHVERPTPN
jgi:uncharacterized protein (TIGR03435 family)